MSPEQQAERAAHVALRNRLAEEARRFRLHWDPQSYRLYLRRELARKLAEMRAQRLARIRRRDAMMDWLRQYESWREANGRPIAYCRRAPAREAKAA